MLVLLASAVPAVGSAVLISIVYILHVMYLHTYVSIVTRLCISTPVHQADRGSHGPKCCMDRKVVAVPHTHGAGDGGACMQDISRHVSEADIRRLLPLQKAVTALEYDIKETALAVAEVRCAALHCSPRASRLGLA